MAGTNNGARTGRRRTVLAILAAVAILGPLGWLWQASLLPDTYSVSAMGYTDGGGGPQHAMPAPGRSVASLTDTTPGPPDVALTLVARQEKVRLASGQQLDGYTLNGMSPGPVIRARQGQIVEVRLVNESVPGGVTLHWHGVDVPNAEDGVAGVTQNAVRPGGQFTYRFRATQVGTFWYHSHQVSHEQVQRGLFGALVITTPSDAGTATDTLALVHIYDGQRTINGRSGSVPVAAEPGTRVRVRVINTDNGPMPVWVDGAGYRLVAVDGTDLHEPTPVQGAAVEVTAGGRTDLEIAMPPDGSGVRVEMGGSASLLLGANPAAMPPRAAQPSKVLDLLSYGSPAPLGFDPATASRRFEYAIGRRPGFVDGQPGFWWTINGHLFPDVPMYMVAAGDVVVMHISNSSGEVHPMHLHGHHAVVLSRNGVPATGSPWWMDSLNVNNGESYDIAFVADNPGIWMDHCHNLPHAAQGLVAHLMYEGVTEPYTVGGTSANEPE
ncbi:MAG: multicopper oxidase family protein [Pseudonocardiaceae bacterium]